MLQTLKLINQKKKKSSFYEEKSLIGLTPVLQIKTPGYLTCPRRIWILQNVTLNGKFVKNLRMKGIWTQIIQKIALQHMEATCCSQFHQHFTISFSFFPKKYKLKEKSSKFLTSVMLLELSSKNLFT